MLTSKRKPCVRVCLAGVSVRRRNEIYARQHPVAGFRYPKISKIPGHIEASERPWRNSFYFSHLLRFRRAPLQHNSDQGPGIYEKTNKC